MAINSLTVNGSTNTMVTIYGSDEALASIEYIPVNVNVEGLSETTEFKVELTKPTDVKSMS
ncbi:MAG: hypothetical protein IJB71_02895, partial [Bacilli bacterium]|nr:hypothetical protein [Bacilli bacterium]